ncbi:MAG: hypothetical protein J6I49_00240 [Bacteroidales bacterium]|nr:hypothetical protein [Bacteroidales bacterium]
MRRLAFIVLPLLLAGCVADRCRTPFGPGGEFDLSIPAYAPLAGTGAMVIQTDLYGYEVGHRGIFVRRSGFVDFVAFDCVCPNDHDIALQPDPGNDFLLRCPVCGSSFETVQGNPLEGSATGCPLYQYHTSLEGQRLFIWP